MSSSVARLHQALVEAIRRNRPNALNGPVTVAEVYQDLVPYRSVRSALGFALNADYEHALLQLLAGVEGRARVEPAEAREALRLELESPNPNTGVFRGYAACEVFVAPINDAEFENEAPAVQSGPVAATVSTPASGLQAVPVAEPIPASSPAAMPTKSAGAGGPDPARATRCHACGHSLPTNRTVRFCPQCGADQQARKCGSCGERLEVDWKYCITCGEAIRQ